MNKSNLDPQSKEPITDLELRQLRNAFMRILGMPREGVACVIILSENQPDGERQRMMSLGLSNHGIHHVLARALRSVTEREPDVTMELSSIVED